MDQREFLGAARAQSGRAHRQLQLVLAGVAALLVLALIAGVVALDERGNARDEAVAAAAQRLGAQALVEGDLDRSLLLAAQGVALEDSVQTRGNLLAALLTSPAAIGVLHGDGDRMLSLDLSPDGRTLAFLDQDGTLTMGRYEDAAVRRAGVPRGPVTCSPVTSSASTTWPTAPTARGSRSAAKDPRCWTRATIGSWPACG